MSSILKHQEDYHRLGKEDAEPGALTDLTGQGRQKLLSLCQCLQTGCEVRHGRPGVPLGRVWDSCVISLHFLPFF